MAEPEGHPVVSGLVALVAVSLLVGAMAGVAALLGSRAVGLSNGRDASEDGTARATMFVPERGAPRGRAEDSAQRAEAQPRAPQARQYPIRLVASPRQVASFGRIYLTGTYPRGTGAILQVQRREGSQWGAFPVTVSVDAGGFRTYVQTSFAGRNVFRMLDSDSGAVSNPAVVTVG